MNVSLVPAHLCRPVKRVVVVVVQLFNRWANSETQEISKDTIINGNLFGHMHETANWFWLQFGYKGKP